MILHLLFITLICLTKTSYGDTDPNYRLNTPIKPSSYAIVITPYFDTGDASAFTFDGEVIIYFTTESTTNQIKLHSEDLTYTASNITVTDGENIISLDATNPLQFIENYTFAYINLQTDLQVGIEYYLKIDYRGPIRSDLNGFYRNYYIEGGVKKWLGATQMEPTHARKAFPCFDEPDLKATFQLGIDRPAGYQQSLANTKLMATLPLSNGYVREVFFPTPKMSTYLVSFLVSEFEAAHYVTNDTREFGIFTRPEAKNQSLYAFDFGKRVVDALGDYFGIDYYSTDINLKLDHVALVDFRAGAMENWGLITYREALILYVPEESTPYYKYRVAQIVAHETTHMWFGNLVTCHWWSNTWLNEGFANYFQDYITALIEPEVGSSDQLVVGSVYAAYEADDSPDAAPITNNDVNSPAEISAHFGTITYQKAGSVIRMMHHLLGDDAFKFGLNAYLNANKFNSGYPNLLYSALGEGVAYADALSAYPGFVIDDVMNSWITQAGHPLLQVDIDYDNETITLSQNRFYINSTFESDEIYKIPITFTTAISPNFEDTKPVFIMDNKNHNLSVANISQNQDWILFNVQETGLYRVNYDEHSWQIISNALKGSQRERIHHLNRAKIVNDLFAFLHGDVVKFNRLYDVLNFLTEETDYSVWYAAIRGLSRLRTLYLGSAAFEHIEAYERNLLDNIVKKLGYEVLSTEGTDALRNRMQVLEFACKIGHQGCIDNTVALFKNLRENGVEITPSLRPVAYCYGLRYGTGDDFEFLWERMSTTNLANEARIIGDALGCTNDAVMLRKYLVSMLEKDSPIKTQDLTVPVTSILANYDSVDLVLDELKENYDLWSTIYPTMDSVLQSVASALHSEEEFTKFESWLSTCSNCSQQAISVARDTLAKARASTAWARDHEADILASLPNHSVLVLPSWIILILGLLAVQNCF